jgi:hypothetical protein
VSYNDIANLKTELIRKAQSGGMFLAPITAPVVPEDPFTYTAAVTGPPAVPEQVDFDLPSGYEDVGFLTDDGQSFENETSESNVSSWQSISPTRTDMISDTDTVSIVAQETKLLTLSLYTGAASEGIVAKVNTGTVRINKPDRPSTRFWRGVGLMVDGEGADEIIIARIMPRMKVTGRVGQRYGKGDEAVGWGVTLTAFKDSTLGYASSYVFGGPGWKALLTQMDIPSAS